MSRVLVTGAAGFIGFHLARYLLARGDEVIGVDNLNDYYDVRLKEARLARLEGAPGFRFVRADLADREAVAALFREGGMRLVAHLAAQAGVRYSLTNPHAYLHSNLTGFLNVLEGCRINDVEHLVFASSSSVYGLNARLPYSVSDPTDHPVSLYGATKKANEVMAHSYAHLYGLPCTGMRFFTVYGPWGRPDMAYFRFTQAILEERPIDLFNNGQHKRDFTYIDDIVEGVVRVLDHPAEPDPSWSPTAPNPSSSAAPYRLYNIGNHQPVELLAMVRLLEELIGQKANVNLLPAQPGDVLETFADIASLRNDVGFAPSTPLPVGLERFVAWYRAFYGV